MIPRARMWHSRMMPVSLAIASVNPHCQSSPLLMHRRAHLRMTAQVLETRVPRLWPGSALAIVAIWGEN